MTNYELFTTVDGQPFVLSGGSELLVVSSEQGLGLITDRRQADLLRAKALAKIGYANMTAEERAEWDTALKGAYNASDFNRVEGAVETLLEVLLQLPDDLRDFAEFFGVAWDTFFDVPYSPSVLSLETKTDWTREDIPDKASLNRYLGNVATLRSIMEYETDELPDSMEGLTIDGANAIEKALELLNTEIDKFRQMRESQMQNTASSWYYSGDVYANEV